MSSLYCPVCGNYLMCGTGECVDCHCGWKQSDVIEPSDEDADNE